MRGSRELNCAPLFLYSRALTLSVVRAQFMRLQARFSLSQTVPAEGAIRG
jgi:hypothetical protein